MQWQASKIYASRTWHKRHSYDLPHTLPYHMWEDKRSKQAKGEVLHMKTDGFYSYEAALILEKERFGHELKKGQAVGDLKTCNIFFSILSFEHRVSHKKRSHIQKRCFIRVIIRRWTIGSEKEKRWCRKTIYVWCIQRIYKSVAPCGRRKHATAKIKENIWTEQMQTIVTLKSRNSV